MKFNVFAALVCVIFIMASYHFFVSDGADVSERHTADVSTIIEKSSAEPLLPNEILSDGDNNDAFGTHSFSPDDGSSDQGLAEFSEAMRYFGVATSEERDGYKAYSNELLEELVLQDDAVAAYVYVTRPVRSNEEMCRRAGLTVNHKAIMGSVPLLAICNDIPLHVALDEKDFNLTMSHYREVLSWFELGIKLENTYVVTSAASHFRDTRGMDKLELTHHDLEIISGLAREKLRNINAYRKERGLDPLEPRSFNFPNDRLETNPSTAIWAEQFISNG